MPTLSRCIQSDVVSKLSSCCGFWFRYVWVVPGLVCRFGSLHQAWLAQGETFTGPDAEAVFFGVTKLFLSPDGNLRRMVCCWRFNFVRFQLIFPTAGLSLFEDCRRNDGLSGLNYCYSGLAWQWDHLLTLSLLPCTRACACAVAGEGHVQRRGAVQGQCAARAVCHRRRFHAGPAGALLQTGARRLALVS